MKNAFIIFLTLFTTISSYAAHIIGGTVAYTVNSVAADGTANFDAKFTVYRDANSNGADFDVFIDAGLYGRNENNGNFEIIMKLSDTYSNRKSIDLGGLECSTAQISAESAEYDFNFTVSPDLINRYDLFTVVYQRCCRNELLNITEGSTTGMALSVDITRAGIQRVGEVKSFNDAFPALASPEDALVYDHSIDDGLVRDYALTFARTAGGDDGVAEGNALSCTGITPAPEMCPPPFIGPSYRVGYGEYGLRDEVTIDSMTGIMTMHLQPLGNYLYTVKADHYENGELLGTAYQQFVQAVLICDPLDTYDTDLPGSGLYPIPVGDLLYSKEVLQDIRLHNVDGQLIRDGATISESIGLDVSDLKIGVYFLSGVSASGESVQWRFVKQ